MGVYLCQCLCPLRHAILAGASEDSVPAMLERTVRATIKDALALGTIKPWCGLCGARDTTWTYETSRTRYATMAEAEPALRQAEAAQIRSAALLKALGLAVDAPPGQQN